jgi:Mg/Co/Ni transporter MgtE
MNHKLIDALESFTQLEELYKKLRQSVILKELEAKADEHAELILRLCNGPEDFGLFEHYKDSIVGRQLLCKIKHFV